MRSVATGHDLEDKMTVDSNDGGKNSYVGDGVNDTFIYTFRLDDPTWMTVSVDEVLSTDYTLDIGNTQIVFNSGSIPADLSTVVLQRMIPITQLVNYPEYGPFPAETHEEALDKLTLIIQEVFNDTDPSRFIKFPIGDLSDSELPIAQDRADLYFAFDSSGDISLVQGTSTQPTALNKPAGAVNGNIVGYGAGQETVDSGVPAAAAIPSTTAETGTVAIRNIVSLTQAAYNLLTPVATTLYVIKG